MPGELALLPLVESAYDPFAYSHGRASGSGSSSPPQGGPSVWARTGGTTDAGISWPPPRGALSYLKQLSERFDGDYELALASYNAGGARVARAMRRNERQGKSTDFWSLQLPSETRHYLPKLIALARIIQNPEAHGIELRRSPMSPISKSWTLVARWTLPRQRIWPASRWRRSTVSTPASTAGPLLPTARTGF